MAHTLRIALTCFLSSFASALADAPSRGDMEEGVAIVTSRKGSPKIITAESNKRTLSLHDVLRLGGAKLSCGKSEHLFISLSNGVGLGLGANTELRIKSYTQRPFKETKESVEHEPSISQLTIILESGTIAFAAERLSPISKFTIQSPTGETRIHTAKGIIRYDSTGVNIAAVSGQLTYYYPNMDQRQFIGAPQTIRISEHSAALGKAAESSNSISSLSDTETLFVKAAEHAGQRVLYKVPPGTTAIPQPVLIAIPEKLKQPSPRPYTFFD